MKNTMTKKFLKSRLKDFDIRQVNSLGVYKFIVWVAVIGIFVSPTVNWHVKVTVLATAFKAVSCALDKASVEL